MEKMTFSELHRRLKKSCTGKYSPMVSSMGQNDTYQEHFYIALPFYRTKKSTLTFKITKTT
jgi:hypothetical protein